MADIGDSRVMDTYQGVLHSSGNVVTLGDGTSPNISYGGSLTLTSGTFTTTSSSISSVNHSFTPSSNFTAASSTVIISGSTSVNIGQNATVCYLGINATSTIIGGTSTTLGGTNINIGRYNTSTEVGYGSNHASFGQYATSASFGDNGLNITLGALANNVIVGRESLINYFGVIDDYYYYYGANIVQSNYYGYMNSTNPAAGIFNYFGTYSDYTLGFVENVYGSGTVSGHLIISSGNLSVPSGEIYGAPYCIWAEESSDATDGSYQYSFGNGDDTPAANGIVIGWRSKLFKIGLNVEHSSALTQEFQLAVLQNGTGMATGTIPNGSSAQSSLTDVSSQNVIFEAGDIINFRTIQDGNVTVSSVRPVAWLKTIE